MAVVSLSRTKASPATRQPPPDRTSAARAALAERIADYNRTLAEIAVMEHATRDGQVGYGAIAEAERRVNDARANLDTAKARGHQNLIRSALGEQLLPGTDEKTATAELKEAEEALTGLQGAQSSIAARLREANETVHHKKGYVEQAANLVLRAHIAPDIDRLIAEINSIYVLAGEKSSILNFLIGRAVENRGPASPPNIIQAECRFTSAPYTWAENQPGHSVLRNRWVSAWQALMHDHTAPLPEDFEP